MAEQAELTGLKFNMTADRRKASEALEQLRGDLKGLKQEAAKMPKITPEVDTKEAEQKTSKIRKMFQGLGKGTAGEVLKKATITAAATTAQALEGLTLGKGAIAMMTKAITAPEKAVLRLSAAFGGRLLNNIRQATSTVTAFGKRFKAVLSYRIFRRFIGEIYKGLTEGKENLYQWSKLMDGTFAANMDRIATSALYLKNAIGTLAEPLINIVTPAFEAFTDTAVGGLNAVAEGLAIITGSNAWTKATKAVKEYGKETGKLAGIDELHIIGSGTANIFDQFKTENVNDELKKLFDAGRYEDFGKKLVQGLNKALKSADNWINGVLRPKGVKWAQTAAKIGNGIIDGFHWYSFGKTAGDAITAAADIINTGLTEFDFRKLGGGVMNSINGLFDAVDWGLLGETFANKWNALIHFVQGAIAAASPWKYGKSLGEMLASWTATIDWETAGENIGNGITKLATNISAFFQNADLKQLALGLADFINRAIETTDWDKVGEALGDFFGGTIEFLTTFIDEVKWKELGRNVGDALARISWGEYLVDFGTSIAGAIFDTIKGSLESKAGSMAGIITGTVFGAFAGGAIGGLPGAAIGAGIGGGSMAAISALSVATDKKKVGGHALGGTVPQGDLFYASERGPEYVGTLGGSQAAVANNASIIEGVKQGVLAAFQQAGGNASEAPREIQITLRTEGRILGETVVDYINGETRRTGNSPLYSY